MTKVVAATEEEGRVPLVLAGSGEKKLIGKYWGGGGLEGRPRAAVAAQGAWRSISNGRMSTYWTDQSG